MAPEYKFFLWMVVISVLALIVMLSTARSMEYEHELKMTAMYLERVKLDCTEHDTAK